MIHGVFYLLSTLVIFTAIMVIISRNPIYSILFLILTFFGITGIYLLLNAQFIAIVNIIVYAGAIMVLFLFAVMTLNLKEETSVIKKNGGRFVAVLLGGSLFLIIIASLKSLEVTTPLNAQGNPMGLVKELGKVLFRDFLLPFEVVSILFLSAMTGAVLLSTKESPSIE